MYHTFIKGQMIKLSNDISTIKIGKRILLKLTENLKKLVFFSYIFLPAISHFIICFNQ